MALPIEAQDTYDRISALKDRYVDTLLSLQGRYNDVASDLSAPNAVDDLSALQAEYAEFKAAATTELGIVNEEKKAVLSNITDPDIKAEATTTFNELINSINDNVIAQLREVRLGIESALVEAKKKAEEAKTPEDKSESDADNTKKPEGADDESGKEEDSSGSTTVAGKAGNSKATDATQTPGLRDYNPLSQFSSYTYKVGLYMMNTAQLNEYMNGNYAVIKDFWLIAQSGGVTTGIDSPRAPGFDLDIYLDDIEIDTLINAKETETATNSINFKFKVYEPFGFSFPHKITQAMIQSQQRNAELTGTTLEQIKSLNEGFFITIKFYGYDKDGNLVNASDYVQPGVTKSDSQSVFERGFPIRLKDFKFRLENKMTVYNITAVQYSEQVGKGVNSGTVPAKISLSGETIRDVLVGKTQDGSKKSVVGLAEILNQMEIDETRKRTPNYIFPNTYKIEFDEADGIADALLVPKDYYVKEKTPMASTSGASNEREAYKNQQGTVEKKTRTIEVPAGQSILQTIDNIIGQSEYVKKMMKAVDKEISEPTQENGEETDVNSNPKTLSWYNINVSAVRGNDWDPKRNDYAHEITYKITKYEIPYIRSLYTSDTVKYYGPHKRYNYWYTGKNTEILSYEQEYNLMYTIEGPMASDVETKNMQSAKTKLKSGQAGVDATSTKSGTNDIVNSVKSFLYSPGDLNKFKMKILGDPDYLMPSIGTTAGEGINRWYGTDYTINPNSGQVFIEIDFQQVEDYNHDTGTLDPNNDILFAMYSDQMKTKPKGLVYMLTHVISTFSKGKFEQTLKGFLPEFANETNKNSATPDERQKTADKEAADRSNQTASTQERTGVNLTNGSAGGGRGGQGGPTAAQLTPNPISKVADDDSNFKSPPVGTYANAGREVVVRSPLPQPKGKSIMFNNNR